MKNNRIFSAVAAVAAVGLVSCAKDGTQAVPAESPARYVSFSAGASGPAGVAVRAGYDGANAIWNAGDQIGLFVGAGNDNLLFNQKEGTLSGDSRTVVYEGTLAGPVSGPVTALACYPYDPAATASGTTVSTRFPGVQRYTPDGYTGIPLFARYEGEIGSLGFAFTNPFAVIELQLASSDALTVQQIVFQGNNGESVAGAVSVDLSGMVPALTFAPDATQVITLDCGAGVTLGTAPTSFYIAVPAQSYSAGCRFDIRTSANGANAVVLTAKSAGMTPAANTIYHTPAQQIAASDLKMVIPDPEFRLWLKDNGFNSTTETGELIGIPSDGPIINCSNSSISSLAGVEYFTNLSTLACASNRLSVLDISKNTQLISLNCVSNELADLMISGNTALVYLFCSSNRLPALDISQNSELIYLDCQSNRIPALDASTMADPTTYTLLCGSQTDADGSGMTLQLTLGDDQKAHWESVLAGENTRVEVTYK